MYSDPDCTQEVGATAYYVAEGQSRSQPSDECTSFTVFGGSSRVQFETALVGIDQTLFDWHVVMDSWTNCTSGAPEMAMYGKWGCVQINARRTQATTHTATSVAVCNNQYATDGNWCSTDGTPTLSTCQTFILNTCSGAGGLATFTTSGATTIISLHWLSILFILTIIIF